MKKLPLLTCWRALTRGVFSGGAVLETYTSAVLTSVQKQVEVTTRDKDATFRSGGMLVYTAGDLKKKGIKDQGQVETTE